MLNPCIYPAYFKHFPSVGNQPQIGNNLIGQEVTDNRYPYNKGTELSSGSIGIKDDFSATVDKKSNSMDREASMVKNKVSFLNALAKTSAYAITQLDNEEFVDTDPDKGSVEMIMEDVHFKSEYENYNPRPFVNLFQDPEFVEDKPKSLKEQWNSEEGSGTREVLWNRDGSLTSLKEERRLDDHTESLTITKDKNGTISYEEKFIPNDDK
jgi:hypothetical protein